MLRGLENFAHFGGLIDLQVVVKEEDEMVYSSDIFAHISGVNSFKCNYPSNLGFDF